MAPTNSLTRPPDSLRESLGMLGALAALIEQAHAALATATPTEIDDHTARQRELCRQLVGFASRQRDGTALEAGLARDLQAAVRRVSDWNRKYAVLRRRRRRTVDIFCRVLASSGTTYSAPQPVPPTPGNAAWGPGAGAKG